MAHAVSITYGTTTISLTLVDYKPTSAPKGQATVTERWEVHVSAESSALLVEEIHKISRAFELARQQQLDPFLDKVYINFLPKDLTDSNRSQVIAGEIEYYDETLKFAWANKAMDLRLTIERFNYWEGALTAIPLTNSNGTDDTSGLNVYNCNDGIGVSPNIRENYADVDGNDIEGDLPAPIRLQMVTSGLGNAISMVVMVNNRGVPSNIIHMIEAEDGEVTSTDIDANCSGGEYGIRQFIYTYPEQILGLMFVAYDGYLEAGRWYLPFLRLQTIPTIEDLWMQIEDGTEWIHYPASGGSVFVQFPPVRVGVPDLDETSWFYNIKAKTSTVGTKTINMDFVYFIPFDGVRFYELGGPLPYPAHTVIDDPYINKFYEIHYSTGKKTMRLMRGTPLEVIPTHDARLFFVLTEVADIDILTTVKAWYRPRRLAL